MVQRANIKMADHDEFLFLQFCELPRRTEALAFPCNDTEHEHEQSHKTSCKANIAPQWFLTLTRSSLLSHCDISPPFTRLSFPSWIFSWTNSETQDLTSTNNHWTLMYTKNCCIRVTHPSMWSQKFPFRSTPANLKLSKLSRVRCSPYLRPHRVVHSRLDESQCDREQ